jgi:hypothetical protein
MTYANAFSILARARHDIEDVAAVLCLMAAIADLGGHPQERDDSIEIAADLLAQLPRAFRCSVPPLYRRFPNLVSYGVSAPSHRPLKSADSTPVRRHQDPGSGHQPTDSYPEWTSVGGQVIAISCRGDRIQLRLPTRPAPGGNAYGGVAPEAHPDRGCRRG